MLEVLRKLWPTPLALARDAVLVAVAFVLGALVMPLGRGDVNDLAMLFGKLGPDDSVRIAAMLDQKGIPYELRSGGAEIWVKQDQVVATRLAAGAAGLPGAGATVGKEIVDRSDALGSTSFSQQTPNEIRALEVELARSIKTLGLVDQVRVHLVLPQRELFSRAQREASASVVLKLKNRSELAPEQTQALLELVAAAVPGLKPVRVSVIDDRGVAYSAGVEDQTNMVQVRGEEQKRVMETRLARQIEEIVGATEGLDNVRAMVAAEMDFKKEEDTAGRADTDQTTASSTQEGSAGDGETDAAGKEPVAVARGLPGQNAAITTGAGTISRSSMGAGTTHFEISRTIRTHERVTGRVTRLSVAVVINGVWTPRGQYVPRTEQEMAELRDFIEKAVGIDYERGDQLTVMNRQFPRTGSN